MITFSVEGHWKIFLACFYYLVFTVSNLFHLVKHYPLPLYASELQIFLRKVLYWITSSSVWMKFPRLRYKDMENKRFWKKKR